MVTEEQELVDRLYRGEKAAFRELVEAHKKKVYFLALDMVGQHADAEDVSQEVFLKVFRSFRTFKRGSKLSSWLYRVTYNACLDHLRRKSMAPRPVEDVTLELLQEGSASLPAPSSKDPMMRTEKELLRQQVERALQVVSAQERAVFTLRHYEGLPLNDIAQALDLSVGSVKSYLHRAVKKIQRELASWGAKPTPEVSHE
ncbi:MAG: RNA polymerase sigma factor [Acidobacteriota bacterium]